jgi:hypothetical protein
MSTSLLLALLETQGNEEPDYSKEYDQWARGDPDRKKLMLDALYEVLQSTINMRMSASGALGTVLARALSNDRREGLADAKLNLRGELRYELIKRFNALKEQYPLGPSSGGRGVPQRRPYPDQGGLSATPLVDEALHQLLDIILQGIRKL